MSRLSKTACVLTVAAFLVTVVLPFAPAAGNVRKAAESRVIMCGRSVLENWFNHWGWDGDNAHTVSRSGYTLQHAENLQDTDQMVGIFRSTCDAVPSGSNPVMFFKFCFVDFSGDNLSQLQGIANQIIQTARDHGLRLIIGNALPVVAADTNPQLVSEHRSYNSWLNTRAGQVPNLWIYDMYGVLSDSSGALRASYASDGDSHPNDAGYNALDATFFPLLDRIFGGQPPPPPPVTAKRSLYFAEGTTANGFEEYICIQNPTVNDATVQATYMLTGGAATQVGAPFTLARTSRTTINVGDVIKNSDVSVRIDASQDVICERSMYWNNRIEGTDSIGVTSPGTTWYLPEGCTAYGFEEYLCIQNPQSASATVNITYNTAQGPKQRDPLTVNANSRKTIKVNDEVKPGNVSITLTSNRGVVAERAMYWDSRRGGHASIGTTSLSTNWFLAEGSNNWGYETFVLVQNPGTADANVSVKFLTTEGPIDMKPFPVSAGSRYTITTRKVVGSRDFSTSITSDQPITCERSMYWNNGTGKAGHDTIGVTAAALNNYLAEGCTNYGFDSYVLIANPNDKPNEVIVTYMTPTGEVPRDPITIDPNSRYTVHVNEDLDWQPLDVSIRVVGNYPVVAERAMYWNAKGGGHDSIGFMSN